MSLKTLHDQVRYMLVTHPETRNSDKALIYMLLSSLYGINARTTFLDVMRNPDLPNFESIRRCRQKIQETEEDLRGETAVEHARIARQEDYIEYARGC